MNLKPVLQPAWIEQSAIALSRARTLGYTLEFLLLRTLARLLSREPAPEERPTWAMLMLLQREIERLIHRDAENIARGVYPLQVLQPESPIRHLRRFPRIVQDALGINRRRAKGRTTEFDPEAKEYLQDVPRYYRRNFHFQTNGYLSEGSGELYDHQVEMLFRGTADAMRRLAIRPLKDALASPEGEGLAFLEIGAGTGAATRMMRLGFPRAKITAVDLSDPYLKVAQRRLADARRVDFLQADGGKLPFKDASFDAAYSVFVFHELPESARADVLKEAYRVLKPGGWLAVVDSIQLGDADGLDEVLRTFPRDFHEPYYRNYIETPLAGLLERAGFNPLESERGFLSKVVWGRKPGGR